MKIRDFINLKTISSTTDTYEFRNILSGYDIPFSEENNKKVVFEKVFNQGDGYRVAEIYRMIFNGNLVAILYRAGRSGRDNYGKFIIDKEDFFNAVSYLQVATRNSLEEEIDNMIDNECSLDEEFNELYSLDIGKVLNFFNFESSLKIGDQFRMDIDGYNESLELVPFKNVLCEIIEIDLKSDYKTIKVKVLDLRKKGLYWRDDYKELSDIQKKYHFTYVPSDEEFIIPELSWDGEKWNKGQLSVLNKEKNNISHPIFYISFDEAVSLGLDIKAID